MLGTASEAGAQTIYFQDGFGGTQSLLENHAPTVIATGAAQSGFSYTNIRTADGTITAGNGYAGQTVFTNGTYDEYSVSGATVPSSAFQVLLTVKIYAGGSATALFGTATNFTGYGVGVANDFGSYQFFLAHYTNGQIDAYNIHDVSQTTPVVGGEYTAEVAVSAPSGGNVVMTLYGGPKNGTLTQVGTYTAATPTATVPGLASLSSNQTSAYNAATNIQAESVLYESLTAPAALAGGSFAVSNLAPTAATLMGAAATGGTPPYAYQWYKSAVSQLTLGAAVAGAASASLTDTALTAGGSYYYRRVTTDSASNVITSSQIAVVTPAKKVVVGCIGDSITLGYQASVPATTSAAGLLGPRLSKALGWAVSVNDQGVNSSTSADWLPASTTQSSAVSLSGTPGTTGGTNGAGSVSTNLYANAKAAFTSTGVNLIQIMLGVNDSKAGTATPPAAYQSNISAIVTQEKADFPGIPIVLIPPTYTVPGSSVGTWTEASDALLQSYGAALANLVAPGITLGKSPYTFTLNNFGTELADGVHPNDAGYSDLASVWLASDLPALLPSAATTRTIRRIN